MSDDPEDNDRETAFFLLLAIGIVVTVLGTAGYLFTAIQ